MNHFLRNKNWEIDYKNEELSRTNRTKDTLFRVIAHDLKSPVGLLVSYTDFLLDNFQELNEREVKKILQNLNQASKDSNWLIDNLLVWARAQTNAIEIKMETLNLKNLMTETLALWQNQASRKEIGMSITVSDSITVKADYNLLSSILRNLLSNAIKFTYTGGMVWVSAKVEGGWVQVEVKDTGVGLKEEDRIKLFNPNTPFSTMGTHHERGTGLGLKLCHEFTEMMGGKIWVSSDPGTGRTFSFTLEAGEPL